MDVVLDILNADSLAITPEFLKLIAVLSELNTHGVWYRIRL